MLRYVAGVSWPRSGHHLLARIMKSYFGYDFRHCEFYGKKECCRAFPCSRQNIIAFSKSHDFDGRLQASDSVPLIIQYRSFAPSIISWFDLRIRDRGYPDTKEAFWKHAAEHAPYYHAFTKKWVERSSVNWLRIRYEDLTRQPTLWCAEAIKLFSPGSRIDLDRLWYAIEVCDSLKVGANGEQVLSGFGVRQTRMLSDFRYFTSSMEEELEQLLHTSLASPDAGEITCGGQHFQIRN
jgi:hypothetical protein